MAKSIDDVRIGETSAEISYVASRKTNKVSKFGGSPQSVELLRREAILSGRVVKMICSLLNAETA